MLILSTSLSESIRNPALSCSLSPAPTPRNHRKMDKYLTHITGRLYFSPKCRKHASHVYHQTRDCTILAYFKRCARLLTRLASSPMCTGDKQR
uniref:ALK and LTK ligand 1 n=1 Tax=Hippocampus comes TaxID=109280 RepID=A0A3Q2Y8W1_HIPCM